jgi:hypothetical protein
MAAFTSAIFAAEGVQIKRLDPGGRRALTNRPAAPMVSPGEPALPDPSRLTCEVTAVAEQQWQAFLDLLNSLRLLLDGLLHLVLAWALLIAWVAWWLGGVNWNKAWAALAQGAWVPVVLFVVVGAMVWSQLAPSSLSLGFTSVPNFWWQFGGVALLAGGTLFLGWLQGAMGWTPPEVPVEPADPEHTHGHEHPVGTLHGHDYAHADEPQ